MKKLYKFSIIANVLMFLVVCLLCYKFNAVSLVVNKIGLSNDYGYDVTELDNYQYLTLKYSMSPNNDNEIIFLGDSITERSYFEEVYTGLTVINRGIGSDTTDGVIYRLDEIVESNPEKIFLMIGINDIGNGLTTDEIIENYTEILDYIQEKSPDTKIYIQSVLPCNSELMEDNQRNANRTTENISELNEKLCNFSGGYCLLYRFI